MVRRCESYNMHYFSNRISDLLSRLRPLILPAIGNNCMHLINGLQTADTALAYKYSAIPESAILPTYFISAEANTLIRSRCMYSKMALPLNGGNLITWHKRDSKKCPHGVYGTKYSESFPAIQGMVFCCRHVNIRGRVNLHLSNA